MTFENGINYVVKKEHIKMTIYLQYLNLQIIVLSAKK